MNKENLNELTKKQQEIKKEDKKAFGKFVIMLVFAFCIGIAVGAGSSAIRNIMKNAAIKEVILEIVKSVAVYGGYVFTTVLLVCSIILYKKSRREYTAWDEEDEEVLCGIETKASYVLWFSNLIMFGSYFFFSTGVWAVDLLNIKEAIQEDETIFWLSLGAVFLHIIYAMAGACIIQQKTINLTKEINPEKTGSIYDMKFQDKWLENCDEAERYTTYKCSFKTFKTMHRVGIVLWLVCLIGQVSFGTGAFATIIVTIYMIIQTSVYSVQGIYFAKHPSEVMK